MIKYIFLEENINLEIETYDDNEYEDKEED